MRIAIVSLFVVASWTALAVPLRHPILMLHGYQGDETTWSDVKQMLMAESADAQFQDVDGLWRRATAEDFLVMSYYGGSASGGLGCTTDTPIEEVAELARYRAETWLENYRGGHAECTFNVLCHSMGGLVFRCMLRDLHAEARSAAMASGRGHLGFTATTSASGLFHRCCDLGTPHWGQLASVDMQSSQMFYASPFLWEMGRAWFHEGASFDRMNFICGVGSTGTEFDWPWDGLVDAVSASLLTREDPEFLSRVAYVNRRHSTAIAYSLVPALCTMSRPDDPVLRLILATFSEQAGGWGDGTGRFTREGRRPGWFLAVDGFGEGESKPSTSESKVRDIMDQACAFVHVAKENDRPVEYDRGTFYNDNVVADVKTFDGSGSVEFSRNNGDEAVPYGNVLVWFRLPVGECTRFQFKIEKPYDLPSGYSKSDFGYLDERAIYGGGVNLVLTYPKRKGDWVRDVPELGDSATVATLAAKRLVASDHDFDGATNLVSMTAANGFSWRRNLDWDVVADDGTVPGVDTWLLKVDSPAGTSGERRVQAEFKVGGHRLGRDADGFSRVQVAAAKELSELGSADSPRRTFTVCAEDAVDGYDNSEHTLFSLTLPADWTSGFFKVENVE